MTTQNFVFPKIIVRKSAVT